MVKILTADPIIEVMSEKALIERMIISEDILEKMKKDKYKYICSIQAKSEAVSKFNDMLKEKYQAEDIKRYGQSGYWHFFVNCNEKEQKKFLLRVIELDKNSGKV
ncbi:MAG: hypothetical protein QGG63_00755 [Candidatus Pacebacteria bacterium]|jgi:hypothetical protein|nr:hypothetical protein [Candidatus Paceibacterota bacterium]|tara:strand:- start:20238 stop:20552 length:315 start_codon:yes stop_codon:yes gene_type:complete